MEYFSGINENDEGNLLMSRGFASASEALEQGEPDTWGEVEDTLILYDSTGEPWVKHIDAPIMRGDLYVFGLKDEDKRDLGNIDLSGLSTVNL